MAFLQRLNRLVWGMPLVGLILGMGIFLSWRTGAAQLRLLPAALKRFCGREGRRRDDNGVSPFSALCTALAATVGIGNIAGVAGAISIGGPGAVFWMWISALAGMMTKFAEAALAVRFRERRADGTVVGGPMYMIRRGLGKRWHWLAGVYSFFGVAAAFGVGNATQINALMTGIREAAAAFGKTVPLPGQIVFAAVLAAVTGRLLMGGAGAIGRAAQRLVPVAAGAYLLLGAGVLLLRWEQVPGALRQILTGAFCPRAVTGGAVGTVLMTLRTGVARGVFTNEAGMGTASIAHAAARVEHPVQQGMMGIVEVFVDTCLICTMTALVILCSGILIPYGHDAGAALTAWAFASVYGGWGSALLAAAVCCFAFATVLGWGLYGIRCAEDLLGTGAVRWFVGLQAGMVLLGALGETGMIWAAAEIVNGLMALPNLIALGALSPELVRLVTEYEKSPVCPGRKSRREKKGFSSADRRERRGYIRNPALQDPGSG